VLDDRIVLYRRAGAAHRVRLRRLLESRLIFALRCRSCDQVLDFVLADPGEAFLLTAGCPYCGGHHRARGERRCSELLTVLAPPLTVSGMGRRRAVLGTKICRAPIPCPVHGKRPAGEKEDGT
jgi:hypothetical protein